MNPVKLLCSRETGFKVLGVHDGFSALLANFSDADAFWGSGFGIAAAAGYPDNNLIKVRELVRKCGEIVRVSKKPLIVDCDEGYGSANITVDLAKALFDVGVAGICIEDNVYPKVNSFHMGRKNKLEDSRTFARKVAKIKTKVSDIFVIARTEALIVGLEIGDAVRRADEYVKFGAADAVIIHSRSTLQNEFGAIISAWRKRDIPIGVIPTKAANLRFKSFTSIGYSFVIYANQLFRAQANAALKLVLSSIDQVEAPGIALASMDEIFNITEGGALAPQGSILPSGRVSTKANYKNAIASTEKTM